jgi:hypothetical protein
MKIRVKGWKFCLDPKDTQDFEEIVERFVGFKQSPLNQLVNVVHLKHSKQSPSNTDHHWH